MFDLLLKCHLTEYSHAMISARAFVACPACFEAPPLKLQFTFPPSISLLGKAPGVLYNGDALMEEQEQMGLKKTCCSKSRFLKANTTRFEGTDMRPEGAAHAVGQESSAKSR